MPPAAETAAPPLCFRAATVFDGRGSPPQVADVWVAGGRISAVVPHENAPGAAPHTDATTREIDARGLWLTPGFIDLHTHYDAEVQLAPGLHESVRHGVTTCVLGSCSVSMIHAEPEDCADIFTRVEGIPREHVLPLLQTRKTWRDAAGYIAALDALPLGPNLASYVGHSDLRAAVMGLRRAVDARVRPTGAELQAMEDALQRGMAAGLLGLSGMTNPWDKVDGDRERSKSLPSTYARWAEGRRLHRVVREAGGVLQTAPNLTNPINALAYLFTSASLGVRRPLRTTLIALMDIKATPGQDRVALWGARLANRLLGANFRWQALPQPFTVYADGIDFVIFEEFKSGEAALHLQRDVDRARLLAEPAYRERFKADYRKRFGGRVWHRDFGDAWVVACPDATLVGRAISEIAASRGAHPSDAFLDLVVEHGRALRWRTTIGNHRMAPLLRNVADPNALIGFSDAGAHIRNMAFYNFGLAMLQLALRHSAALPPEHAVARLTGEIADWLGLDAGRLAPGARADLVLIDPAALQAADLGAYAEAPLAAMGGLKRMVNRHDGVVRLVAINGRVAFENDAPAPALGVARGFGRFLRRPPGGTVA